MGKENKIIIRTPDKFSADMTNRLAVQLFDDGIVEIRSAFLAKDVILAGHSVGFNEKTGKVVSVEPIDHAEGSR